MNERIGAIAGLVLVALLLIGCSGTPAATAAELADSYRLTMLETWANAEAHEWEIRARTAGASESVESTLLRWANLEAQEWQSRAQQEAAGPRLDAQTLLRWANLEAQEWQSRAQQEAAGPRLDAQTLLYWANLEALEWQSRARESAVAGIP